MGFGPTGAVLPATSISRSTGRGQRNKHTITNVYRASRDLFLAQRFARHVSPLATTIYTHPSGEATWERMPDVPNAYHNLLSLIRRRGRPPIPA